MEITKLNRREFMKKAGVATGGFVVAYYIAPSMKHVLAQAPKPPVPPAPNAFVQIAPDNTITLVINKLEMGQGVNTSLAQLIAEELEADWKQIRSVSAPVNPVYNHTFFGTQMTGGSSALLSSWEQHRKIGASMREMLKTAAAQKWGVPVTEVRAEKGYIHHKKKGKLSYGELAEAANKLPLPENAPLKSPKDFKIIGKSVPRVDAKDKSKGSATFGIDIRIPGMSYAMIARPHMPGSKLKSFDEAAARKVKGVTDVVKFGDRVAVLAKNTHAARTGRDLLAAKFDEPKASTAEMMKSFREQAKGPGLKAREIGSIDEAMKSAKTTLTAEYEFPYLAHASMEPMNCTINFDGKTAEIWSGHQMPTADRDFASKVLGIPLEKITINTTYAGGSFGRRGNKAADYVVEACELAKAVKKPLKVVWSREDDMRGGYYRPMTFHKVTLGFDDKKQLKAWDHMIVGQTVIGGSAFEGMMVKDGLEPMITEGVADTHYDLPAFRCQQIRATTPMTTLWWRSVGHTHTAYVMETMIDELAEEMKIDPLKLRKQWIKKSPRHQAVLALLEKMTKWGTAKPPKGRAWGLAVHESFNSVVGHVAEVSIQDGTPRVHKVWSAVDAGTIVHPEGARTQVEGGIVYGLSAAFTGEIKIADGQIEQANFHNYPVMRIQEMPVVKVEFVKSEGPPTGLGEPGVPPIAPAVANALFRLTKKRLRLLPFTRELKA
ncbi:MAG: xanthine dehydrogenase family protein molybdopterin-binding subunit [Bdellovibrionia bacterium]